MESSHINGLASIFSPVIIIPAVIFMRETIRENGFWEGLKESAVLFFFTLLILVGISSFVVWIFTDDTKTLLRNIKDKDFVIDYIPLATFDAYRKFEIDKETYQLCEKRKYSPACFSLANEYVIHDNRSRSEYYLKKIINNEMDKCRLKGDISSCENIIKAYKKLDDMEEVKEYKKLVDALKEQRNLFWAINFIIEEMVAKPKKIKDLYERMSYEARKKVKERDKKVNY